MDPRVEIKLGPNAPSFLFMKRQYGTICDRPGCYRGVLVRADGTEEEVTFDLTIKSGDITSDLKIWGYAETDIEGLGMVRMHYNASIVKGLLTPL